MKRREFVTILGGATAAWPLTAGAQQRSALPVVGLLSGVSFEGAYAGWVENIRQGLKETGFVEGQNLAIEYRTAEGRPEQLPALAADLVRRQVAVIVVIAGSAPALAAQAATSTIPIVFAMGGDAVELGLVKSFSRPEANITGMSFTTNQLGPKRLDLLRQLVPHATLVAYLDNSGISRSFEFNVRNLTEAARAIGRQIVVFEAGTEPEIENAFTAMVQQKVGGLVVSVDAYLVTRHAQIIALAARHSLPTIYSLASAVMQGGLICYGTVNDDLYRQAGIYAGRILKGAKPSDLPVMLPTKFALMINMKTAATLGLTVPLALQIAADELVD